MCKNVHHVNQFPSENNVSSLLPALPQADSQSKLFSGSLVGSISCKTVAGNSSFGLTQQQALLAPIAPFPYTRAIEVCKTENSNLIIIAFFPPCCWLQRDFESSFKGWDTSLRQGHNIVCKHHYPLLLWYTIVPQHTTVASLWSQWQKGIRCNWN